MPDAAPEAASPGTGAAAWPDYDMSQLNSQDPEAESADYRSRLDAAQTKLKGIRRLLPKMAQVAENVKRMSVQAKVKSLNSLFGTFAAMGYDLSDPRDAQRLQQDLFNVDPRWPALLEQLLISLDPANGPQPNDEAGKGLGQPSPLNAALAQKIAEEMGMDVSGAGFQLPGEEAEPMPGEEPAPVPEGQEMLPPGEQNSAQLS